MNNWKESQQLSAPTVDQFTYMGNFDEVNYKWALRAWEKLLELEKPLVDWKELREKFDKECTICVDTLYGTTKVNMAPHDLFEWFKKELEAEKGSQPSDAVEEIVVSIIKDCLRIDINNQVPNYEITEGRIKMAARMIRRKIITSKPSKEEDLDVTGDSKDSASVASHTCTDGNSIEQ